MKFEVMEVTPEQAATWLAASEGLSQRSLNRARVEKLCHAIEDDQWLLTNQGILLDSKGAVRDGQHRLSAVVATGIAVPMLVCSEADEAVFGVIDTGKARTPADTLKIAGYSDTNILAAMVRAYLTYTQLMGTPGGEWNTVERTITSTDLLEWLETGNNANTAKAALHQGRRVAGALARWGTNTPIGTALMVVMLNPNDIGDSARVEFIERLCDGVMLPAGSPILALRRWLVSDTGFMRVPGTSRRQVTIAAMIKAMNDYALGVERQLSIFRWGVETLPLPIAPGTVEEYHLAREQQLVEEEAREVAEAKAAKKQRAAEARTQTRKAKQEKAAARPAGVPRRVTTKTAAKRVAASA